MKIPEKKIGPTINFFPFLEELEKKHNIDVDKLGENSDECFWDFCLEYVFTEIHKDGVHYLSIFECLEWEGAPEWGKEIVRLIHEEVKGTKFFDGDMVRFWIEW